MQRCGARLLESSVCSLQSTSAPRTTLMSHLHQLLHWSGADCTSKAARDFAVHCVSLTLLACTACTFCSSVCTVECSRRRRATTPCAERYHQRLSTAPPYTSTPHSQRSLCIDCRTSRALAPLPPRAIRCRCAHAGWAEAEGRRGESRLFTQSSARLESAHWRGGGCRGFSTQRKAKAASSIDNGRSHRRSN